MPFPFTIKFTTKAKETFSSEEYPIVFTYLSDYLEEKGAMDVVIKKNVLNFNVEFNRSNFHLVIPVDRGEFTIIDKNECITLTYKIFLYRIFWGYSLLSFLACALFKSVLFGSLLFVVVYGSNLLVNAIIHSNRFIKITKGIDTLVQQQKALDISGSPDL
jgi:hypothetical protein